MKRLFTNTLWTALMAFTLVAVQSCNDEVRKDHDGNRVEENSKQLNGAEKPSEYSKEYDTLHRNKPSMKDSGY